MKLGMQCALSVLFACALAACGGGSGGSGGTKGSSGGSISSPSPGCSGGCAAASPTALTAAEVQRIVSQAVLEAQTRGAAGTIAVVDRSGNVLGVYRMTGAAPTFTITSGRGVSGGLEGVNIVPSEYAAISKALTGAYLSSEGNAFSTRTASQIVQENFNPGENGSPGGPLFGVQFSSLSCSDIVLPAAATQGPKGSPLGLAADPGGLPLYKNGTVVGGVGVIADGIYGLDLNVNNVDVDTDELIALAASSGFGVPPNRRADQITVDGRTLRFVDTETLLSNPSLAPAVPAAGSGIFVLVPGYSAGAAIAGTAFTTPASGVRADTNAAFSGLGAYALVDAANANRYPPVNGAGLTATEVTAILAESLRVANRSRAQIRLPLGSPAQVSVSVVDSNGNVVGLVLTADAPVFGTDVAVQKARTALLFSAPTAAASLNALGAPISSYVTAMQAFIPGGTALTDGVAYTARAIGNLARPFFPDGINGNPPGPLSKPFASWSPFNDGLQLDLVQTRLVANLGVVPTAPCTGLAMVPNGIQIFPGGEPIYRGGVLVGAVGVSGDGVDQDDLIGFLGLANAAAALGTGIGNAPTARRADQIGGLPGGQLRYVSCPIAPFLDTNATNVCNGL